MSNSLRFGDHTAFHLQVLRLSLVGAAIGLLTYLISFAVSSLSGPAVFLAPLTNGSLSHAAGAAWLTVMAAVFGLAVSPPTRKTLATSALLALGVGLLGALSYLALSRGSPRYVWFGVLVYGLSVGIVASRDLRDPRRYLVPLTVAAAVALARYVVLTFSVRLDFAEQIPAFAAESAYGAIFGFLVSVGLIARQVRLVRDPVAQAFQEIRPNLSGEMLELCQRAVTLYSRVSQVLHDRSDQGTSAHADLTKGAQDLVLRIFGLARRWQEVEREASRTSAAELAGRIDELDGKISNTKDPVARKQYRLAREALNTQLGYLSDISRSGERVTAQVYNLLTTLERLHLAVINHRGADAAKLSDEVQPILDEIDNVGTEMDYASDAINEVSTIADGEQEPDAPTPEPEPEPEPESEEPSPAAEPEAAGELPAAEQEGPQQPAEAEEQAEEGDDPESRLNARLYE